MTVYTCIQENIKLRKNSIDQCKIEPKVHIRCFLHCLHHSAAPVLNLSTVSVVAFAPSNNIICNIDVQETLDIKIIPCSNKTETHNFTMAFEQSCGVLLYQNPFPSPLCVYLYVYVCFSKKKKHNFFFFYKESIKHQQI